LKEIAIDEEERGGAELLQAVTAVATATPAATARRRPVRMAFLGSSDAGWWTRS
jgi:hypothetical protein